MGEDCWEMPFNGETTEQHPGWNIGHPPRHWYFPIVFPEHLYPNTAVGPTGVARAPHRDAGEDRDEQDAAGRPPRKIELHSWRDELAMGAFTSEALDAPSRWQPVSRRRFRGKGWHIDVGPGFPNDGLRHDSGHPFQCVVLLLLLSDSDPGGGGTVMIPGSQRMVAAKLRAEEPAGISHEDLNAWCVEQVLTAIKAESLCLSDDPCSTAVHPYAVAGAGSVAESGADAAALPRMATQIVGKAGDVVLMHPLTVHCGSTNLSSHVRIMGNGMVRMNKAAFELRQGMFFAPPSPLTSHEEALLR